jgi:hypothetical protein
MTDARRVARRLLITVVVLVVVVPIAAVVAVFVSFEVATRPLDVAKAARAADVTTAHRTVAAFFDDRLDAVIRAAPAASARARSVTNVCESSPSFLGERAGLTCTRAVVRYLGTNGARVTQQRAWEKRMQAAGWLRAEPLSAADPRGFAYRPAAGDRPPVRIRWTERPGEPEAVRAFDRGSHSPTFGNRVNLDDEPVDTIATYRRAYAHYRYVVAVSIEATYYPVSPVPSAAPSPAVSHSPAPGPYCIGGDRNCPGG